MGLPSKTLGRCVAIALLYCIVGCSGGDREAETVERSPSSGQSASGLSATPSSTVPTGEEFVVWNAGREERLVRVESDVAFGHRNAPPIYLVHFPSQLAGNNGHITLPSGYQPQGNPDSIGFYWDYVLARPLGEGVGPFPYRVQRGRYVNRWVLDDRFRPARSSAELDRAVRAGHLLTFDDDQTPYWVEESVVLMLYRAP
jgi:hypothetical protein